MRLQFRVSQPAANPLEICWAYLWVGCPAHFTITTRPSCGLAHDRKRKVRPWSIESDACWHHLHLSVNFSWHEASEEGRETDGEKGRETMSECKWFSHIILVYRHSAGAVRSSRTEVMTMSGWHATTCLHDAHAHKPERTKRHITLSTIWNTCHFSTRQDYLETVRLTELSCWKSVVLIICCISSKMYCKFQPNV